MWYIYIKHSFIQPWRIMTFCCLGHPLMGLLPTLGAVLSYFIHFCVNKLSCFTLKEKEIMCL
jgi:hypothetical protein